MYAGIEIERKTPKYNLDAQDKIFELIKSLNAGGRGGIHDIVNCAIAQYDYFQEKIKEANENA